MLGKLQNAINKHVSCADIMAPVMGKVQELRDFSEARRAMAIELRKKAEQLYSEAEAHENEADHAASFANRIEEVLYA